MRLPDLEINVYPTADSATVAEILQEAGRWLERSGMPLWREDELHIARIAVDVDRGLFLLAECAGEAAGVMKFQLHDPVVWPDLPNAEAAYVHRLAVRRRFAGKGVSTALLGWAVGRTQELGRRYLRLDCEASRSRLRAIYERFGFLSHSERQVGAYLVARYELDVKTGALKSRSTES